MKNVPLLGTLWLLACDSSSDPLPSADAGTHAPSFDASTLLDATPGPLDAQRAQLVPACSSHDGRCTRCLWSEGSTTRCRISIFPGTCPSDSQQDRNACPGQPEASCNRTRSDYLSYQEGQAASPYADFDFYYGSVSPTAEAECMASDTLLAGDAGPHWIVY